VFTFACGIALSSSGVSLWLSLRMLSFPVYMFSLAVTSHSLLFCLNMNNHANFVLSLIGLL
jgi:hypothetical protein